LNFGTVFQFHPTHCPLILHIKSINKYQMKLIHIADTRLGLTAFNRLDPGSGMNLREKQVYDNF